MSRTESDDMHRIGGGSTANLRLKPREAARQVREAFPAADRLHETAQVVGSTTADKIRRTGFDIIPYPTRKLLNHYRLIHPDGAMGFNDENFARLSAAFTDTSGHTS